MYQQNWTYDWQSYWMTLWRFHSQPGTTNPQYRWAQSIQKPTPTFHLALRREHVLDDPQWQSLLDWTNAIGSLSPCRTQCMNHSRNVRLESLMGLALIERDDLQMFGLKWKKQNSNVKRHLNHHDVGAGPFQNPLPAIQQCKPSIWNARPRIAWKTMIFACWLLGKLNKVKSRIRRPFCYIRLLNGRIRIQTEC